jgi:hypothetical protein
MTSDAVTAAAAGTWTLVDVAGADPADLDRLLSV